MDSCEKQEIMNEIISDLARLFGDVKDMSEMDSADFVDNSGKIFELRQRAIELVNSEE